MNVVYAESSAVLSWLLGEPRQGEVVASLAAADRVVTSVLTAVECGRGISRARDAGRITAAEALAASRMLDEAVASWNVMDLSEDIARIARAPFPGEPIRTLDAVQLATALVFHEAIGSVRVVSLDERVRGNAVALGMSVLPA